MVDPKGETDAVLYGVDRWARAVVAVATSGSDPRTVPAWGRLVGASRTTIGNWCRAAGLPVRQSLELGRVLRAARLTGGDLREVHNVMDIVDVRTVRRLLNRAGLASARLPPVGAVDYDLLGAQRLIKDARALATLRRHLAATRRDLPCA